MAEENPITATLYFYIPRNEEIDWDELNTFRQIFNIILAFEDANNIPIATEKEYKSFWSYPVSTYWELNGILDLGACEVLLDAPLYFDLKNVKTICKRKNNAEIRLIANECFSSYIKRNPKTGIYGTYIRPEDIEAYEKYVSHIEFITDSLEKELTLIKIYKEQKLWPGNLNLLLNNLGTNVDNRGFDKEFARRRMNCAQRCQNNGRCHFCHLIFSHINIIDRNRKYLDETYGPVS